jgi:ABC-type transport system substrate-binding protein
MRFFSQKCFKTRMNTALFSFKTLRFITTCALLAVHSLPAAGAPEKVLRVALINAETGFDPAQVDDLYSRAVLTQIFESMLIYDYLARPVQLKPNTLTRMPEVSSDFKTFTFHLQPGIFFADDPAFNGKPRELLAQDYVYTLKRIFDPRWKSKLLGNWESERIVGMDALRKQALQNKTAFNYDTEVPGLRALDRYTLRIELERPSPRFLYNFTAGATTGAMAREVVERYGDAVVEHPVGTGPFRLTQWKRASKIVLTRNPNYRTVIFQGAPGAGDAFAQQAAAALNGKRLPLLDRIELDVITESQPRWLSYLNGQHDIVDLPNDFAGIYFAGGKLAAPLQKRGMQAHVIARPDMGYASFNMEDPTIGGYAPAQVALRRAISLAYDTRGEIRLVRRGLGTVAQSFVVPGTFGYDPTLTSAMGEYDPVKAKALLDLYGFIDRDGDGWRERPDGSPLVLRYATTPDQISRQFNELWAKYLRAVGLRITFDIGQWPEQMRKVRSKNFMIWGMSWTSGAPDSDVFFSLGAAAFIEQSNLSRFNLPRFNSLYEQQNALPDGPERLRVLNEANQLLIAYMPIKLHVHRTLVQLTQPWVKGYMLNPFALADGWRYVDIDMAQRAAQSGGKP